MSEEKEDIVEEEKNTDIEKLYVSNEYNEFEIEGIHFKVKVLTGLEYTEIHDEMGTNPEDPKAFKSSSFLRFLLEKCIIEPKGIDVSRLKADVLAKISSKIQDNLNVPEEMDNLN